MVPAMAIMLICGLMMMLAVEGQKRNCTGCNYYECNCGIFWCNVTVPPLTKKYYEKGLPNGTTTARPLIDIEFMYGQIPFCPCTYLRIFDSCEVDINTGFYLGAEMNLMRAYTDDYTAVATKDGTLNLQMIALDNGMGPGFYPELVCTNNQKTGLNNCMRKYDESQIRELNDLYMLKIAEELGAYYDKSRSDIPNALKFEQLPRNLRTSLFYDHYYKQDPSLYPDVWRKFILEDWEGVIEYIQNSQATTTDLTWIGQLERQRSLIEYSCIFSCPTINDNLKIVFLVDSIFIEESTELLKSMIELLKKQKNNARISVGIVWTRSESGDAASKDVSPLNAFDPESIDLSDLAHGTLYSAFTRASSMLLQPASTSLKVLVYVGNELLEPEKVFARSIALEADDIQTYAISPTDTQGSNTKYYVRASNVQYTKTEITNLVEALQDWANFTCTIHHRVKQNYEYTINSAHKLPSTEYFAYVELSTNSKALNVTVRVTPEKPESTRVFYSTRFKYPGNFLRDGEGVFKDGSYLISFSYTGKQNSLIAITYYFSIVVNSPQKIAISVTEGVSPMLKSCDTSCKRCDLMGQNCRECVEYYENVRGICKKAYTETIVPCSTMAAQTNYVGLLPTSCIHCYVCFTFSLHL